MELPAHGQLRDEVAKTNKQIQIQLAKAIYQSIEITITHFQKTTDELLADAPCNVALSHVTDGSTDQPTDTATAQARFPSSFIGL